MGYYLFMFLFYSIPIGTIIFFITSLVLFLRARKKDKENSGSVSEKELKHRKIMLIISSCCVALLTTIVIAFIILISMAIRYM